MPEKISDDSESILNDFLGTLCAGCGAKKLARMSHCRKCYWTLPLAMRSALWKRFGSGYEEAFRAATKFLLDERKKKDDSRLPF